MILLLLLLWQPPAAPCGDAAECRRQATDAAARGDFESFHDLAWRAVQKGRPNDPDLMFLLARAQALSGRPGDALVMLGRVADLGGMHDVTADPDFARVRALGGWPEIEAKLAGKPAVPSTASSAAAPAPPPPAAPAAAPAPATPADTLSFSAPGVEPFALAHDAVSRRFVLGDRKAHRLLVIDEISRNVVNYVSAASAGFYDELTGLTIDARRGDLWVVSAKGAEAAATSVLHKLQLVSGRSLLEVPAPERSGPIRLVALTVAPDGTVYALDGIGPRLFRLRPGARALDLVMRLDAPGLAALTAADDRTLYLAGETGLVRLDLSTRSAARVQSSDRSGDLHSLSWRAGALLGIEPAAGKWVVVQLTLDRSGTRITARRVLGAAPTATVGTVAGDSFYYLSDGSTISRIELRR